MSQMYGAWDAYRSKTAFQLRRHPDNIFRIPLILATTCTRYRGDDRNECLRLGKRPLKCLVVDTAQNPELTSLNPRPIGNDQWKTFTLVSDRELIIRKQGI